MRLMHTSSYMTLSMMPFGGQDNDKSGLASSQSSLLFQSFQRPESKQKKINK